MSRSPKVPQTISDLVWKMPTPKLSRDLDKYRLDWEKRNKCHIDLTKRYTSLLSEDDQHWLAAGHPDRFVEGLPEFAREYLYDLLKRAEMANEISESPWYVRDAYAAYEVGSFAAEEERLGCPVNKPRGNHM